MIGSAAVIFGRIATIPFALHATPGIVLDRGFEFRTVRADIGEFDFDDKAVARGCWGGGKP